MFKISDEDKKTLEQFLSDAEDQRSNVDDAIDEFNRKVKKLFEATVQPAVDDLNLAIEQINNHTHDIHDQMEEYFDDQSEDWQEGNEGQAFADWMGEFDSDKDLDEVEVEEPTPIEMPDIEIPVIEDMMMEPE